MTEEGKKGAPELKAQEGVGQKKEDKVEEKKSIPKTAGEEIREALHLLQTAVLTKDRRLLARVPRTLNVIKRKLTYGVLAATVKQYYPDAAQFLAGVESKVMVEDTEEDKVPAAPSPTDSDLTADAIVPEGRVYIHLLVTQFLTDKKLNDEAARSATALFKTLQGFNRRTMDLFSARAYALFSLTHERIDKLADIRGDLLAAHRTACLQHNEPGQAALTNAILRNFLHYSLFDQADKFRLNSTFPESRSNEQHARYLYYTGRINAVQLHYSDAYANLTQAIRKAPVRAAVGFRQKASELMVIVQLLMGDIPERAIFRQADLTRPLKPYFKLTQAVRVGDLAAFNDTLAKFKDAFVRDGTYSLIIRLRHNVIKAGLRKINLSYSRISLADICHRLNLPNEEDAEYIVAKAIADGVIDAVVDRSNKLVYSKENLDVYSTTEPHTALHKRILFCVDVHNDAVKALQYPPGAHKAKTELDLLEAEDDDYDEDKDKPSLLDDED